MTVLLKNDTRISMRKWLTKNLERVLSASSVFNQNIAKLIDDNMAELEGMSATFEQLDMTYCHSAAIFLIFKTEPFEDIYAMHKRNGGTDADIIFSFYETLNQWLPEVTATDPAVLV